MKVEPLSTFAAKQHSRIGILTLGIGTYVLCTLKWFHHLSSMEGVFLWVAPRFLRLHVFEEAIISLLPRRLSHRMTSSAVSRFWVHFKRVFWVCIHHLSSVWPPHALPIGLWSMQCLWPASSVRRSTRYNVLIAYFILFFIVFFVFVCFFIICTKNTLLEQSVCSLNSIWGICMDVQTWSDVIIYTVGINPLLPISCH